MFQVLKSGEKETKYKFENTNPFIGDDEEGEVASVAYRYRKWDLDNGIVSFTFSLLNKIVFGYVY